MAIAFAIPLLAAGADYPWLTFRMADDTEISVAAENLNMKYLDGYLHLSSSNENRTIPVEQIKSMKFTSHSSGIKEIEDMESDADYYNLSGICVGRFSSVKEARKALTSGIYIVKSERKTFKVTI